MKRLVFIPLVMLLSCNDDEFIPPSFIDFEQVAVFETWNVHNAAGFESSEELNSLFIASREPNPETGLLGERLLRYDVESGSISADYIASTDFVTKEIHISEENILVIAASYLNTYDLSFAMEPTSISHGLSLSRFGSVAYEGNIYIWGGDLRDEDSDKIKLLDRRRNTFETIATLPARKAGAHGEVIGNKLYIFGGQEHYLQEPPNDVIFIYDFVEETIETASLPVPVYRTFTDVFRDKIFIAGQLADDDPFTQDLDIFFAIFNPDNNSTTEIPTSLNDEQFRTIHQMTILGDDMFVLYGDVEEDLGQVRLMQYEISSLF